MSYLDQSIFEIHQAIINGLVTPLELVQEALKLAKEDNNNAFEYICEKEAIEQVKNLDLSKKDNLLWGIPYALKDNLSTKDIPTCASSKILEGYVPVYSAEVYQRLQEQGAILIGKTTLDELSMGGSGTTGHLGKTYNPWDPKHKHQIGGSSCGSAAVCSAGIVPFALGSDTGDSVRKPASYSCLVGLKPTWGRISRYGLFPFAPSMDHIGFFTRNCMDSALILSVLAGHDEKDSTSSTVPVDNYLDIEKTDISKMRIAVIDEIFDSVQDKTIKDAFIKTLNILSDLGLEINHVHMDDKLCRAIYPTYFVISCAEANSNNANQDGIKFGTRYEAEDYEKVMFEARTNGFSEPIKRRFVLGSYALLKENQEDLFLRAQKCRRLIVNCINEILKDNDAIYLPTSPTIAPLFDGNKDKLSNEYLIADNYLAFANMGGQPSINIPIGFKDGLPFGGCFTGRIFEEKTILSLALFLEKHMDFANKIAKKENE
ncbi:MAG: aspartyl/glutamyl-tRNA amidotransferase subunit A [Bacilli bacterium]|nr:aspartyl/glutamyl-tRNA amidotransferase subunit A [Bacilli bacterium]